MIVYAITNQETGRRYIGITATSLRRRWDAHTKAMRDGVKTALYDAMRSYGADKFSIDPIASLLPDFGRPELCLLERDMIVQEGTKVPHGYNLTDGGDGGPIYFPTAEDLAKRKNRVVSAETRAKMSASLKGKKRTEETKLRIGAASKGRNVGRKHSDDERQRQSERQLGRDTGRKGIPLTGKSAEVWAVAIAKGAMVSAAKRKGVPLTEEHKAKIKAAAERRKMAQLEKEAA